MGPAPASHTPGRRTTLATWCFAVWSVVRFGLFAALASLVLSLFAIPWVEEGSWWTAIRRCVSIGAALSLWFSITKLERRSIRSYGFSSSEAGRRQFFFGALLGLGALLFMLLIGLVSGACRIEIVQDRVKLWSTLLGFIPAATIVSVLEELVFRGFILQQLLTYSPLFAVIASSGLYAAVHVKTVTWTMSTAFELVGLFLLGGVLCLSYLKTQQLYCSVGLHASLAYGARVNKLLIGFENSAAGWFVGTSRLVNGVANWILLLAIGGILLWWMRPTISVGHATKR